MKPFPTDFSEPRPILVTGLSTAAQEAARTLRDKGYEVYAGLDPAAVADIGLIAQQLSLREYTPKDRTQRFANAETAQKWLSKGRAAYLLFKKDGSQSRLAGYGWCGPQASSRIPKGEVTFAPRISEADQGNGLAAPFSLLILLATAHSYDAQNFWLETWESNAGAVHIYKKMGFVEVDREADTRLSASGDKVDDVRLYMQWPAEHLAALLDS